MRLDIKVSFHIFHVNPVRWVFRLKNGPRTSCMLMKFPLAVVPKRASEREVERKGETEREVVREKECE